MCRDWVYLAPGLGEQVAYSQEVQTDWGALIKNGAAIGSLRLLPVVLSGSFLKQAGITSDHSHMRRLAAGFQSTIYRIVDILGGSSTKPPFTEEITRFCQFVGDNRLSVGPVQIESAGQAKRPTSSTRWGSRQPEQSHLGAPVIGKLARGGSLDR